MNPHRKRALGRFSAVSAASIFATAFACAGLLAFTLTAPRQARAADDFRLDPLPLARNAKPKPDETAPQKREREFTQLNVQTNVLLSTRDYSGLDKLTQDWREKYEGKRISGDDYADLLKALAPTRDGKGMVPDLLAWTQARPQSYAAWYALGLLYLEIAWAERGSNTADKTTRAQFDSMQKYAGLAREALLKSLTLDKRPVPTYRQLVRAAAIVDRSGITDLTMGQPKRFCPAVYYASGFPRTWYEQIYYTCLSLRDDPDATRVMFSLFQLASPRWGGNYERLEALLAEVQADRRTSPRAMGVMKSYLLEQQASDVECCGNSPYRAAELYVQAFNAAPLPENVHWLSRAGWLEKDNAKNLDRALVIFRRMTEYPEGQVEGWGQVGWIAEEKGDLKGYMEGMRTAANLGMKEAQNNLGYYYMVGQRGLPRDLQQAKAWTTLAANQGFEHAREKLALIDALIAKEKAGK